MSQKSRKEVMNELRRRYVKAGREYRKELIDQAVELFGYHRKSAIRALGKAPLQRKPGNTGGRPRIYDPGLLGPWLRPIWQAADYPCAVRLRAMLPEWVPAYEQFERSVPADVREQLLSVSARTLDRLLEPLRIGSGRRSLTRPGTLIRKHIPVQGSIWQEGIPGNIEVDTVALCGGSVKGQFVWMLDGVDHATTWVEVRAIWGRGQTGTLEALQDMEVRLPFPLVGIDSDNGGEFLNHHVVAWLQGRPRPIFQTRSRPYKKDDNAHVEQKNWTHIRQWFGYERHDNPEVVAAINELAIGPYRQLLNFFHASLKLREKEWRDERLIRRHGQAQTPLARVLANEHVSQEAKEQLQLEKAGLNPFALKKEVARALKQIDAIRTIQC